MAAPMHVARIRFACAVCGSARHAARRTFATTSYAARQGPGSGENFSPVNDPTERKLTPNVSKTNETPVDSMGLRDAPLQEMVPDAEKKRQMQAPNRQGVWSRSQMPRELAMSGPRFEQTIMEAQVRGPKGVTDES